MAAGALARYVVRAKIRMDEEAERGSKEGEEDSGGIDNVNSLAKVLQQKSIGVDIGSTQCRLAIRQGESTKLLENSSGQYSMPAYILNSADGVTVGSFAKKNSCLKPMSTMSLCHVLSGISRSDPLAVDALKQFSISCDMSGGDESEVAISANGETFTASQMRSLFAKELFQTAYAKDLEAAMLPAVVSVPNYFSDQQKVAAVDAVRNGGMNVIYAIPDALSSVLGMFARGHLPELLGKFLVIDVGGRLTQISVLDCHSADEEPTIVAEKTIFVGSDSVNDLLMEHVANHFYNDTGIQLLNDVMAKQRLVDAVESMKVDLSSSMSANLNVPYITADAQGQPKHLSLDMSRSKFESIVESHTDILAPPIYEVLEKAGINNPSEQLKAQLVVGGGARVPAVLKAVNKAIGETSNVGTVIHDTPEEVNAVGSAQFPKHY